MSDDVMTRLESVQPLPRGERMARTLERSPANRGEVLPDREWRRLLVDSMALLYVAATYSREKVLRYASPLRRCREERKRLYKEVLFLEQHALDAVDNDNALRTEIASLRLSKEEKA